MVRTTHRITLQRHGGLEQLVWSEEPLPPPASGEVQLRQCAIGVNFIDTYHRSGLYPVPLPSGIGLEGAGVVEALGADVNDFQVGDRVAYGTGPLGAYAERRNLPARHLVRLPEGIGDEVAAAMMLQGMTAEYLIHRTYAVRPGDWVLFHTAAGGVGSFAVQWLRHLGAHVIGTVGSEAKVQVAKALGCSEVINYRAEDWVAAVREFTAGEGVAVVYDGVGRDTFMASLACLRPRGMMVTFGNASGPAPDCPPLLLSQKGSLFLTRPTLADYVSSRVELELSARRVLAIVAAGVVRVQVGKTYALRDAAEAHRDLQERRTTGALVLAP